MKLIILYVFSFIIMLGCNNAKPKEKQDTKDTIDVVEIKTETIGDPIENKGKGFLYVNINKLLNEQKRLVILDKQKDTLAFFKDKNVFFNSKEYDIIDDEHLYKGKLNINTFFPEYGLFILDCKGSNDGYYQVVVNDIDCYIRISGNESLLKFKTPEEYIMESYPYLYKNSKTPLRKEPVDNSEIIKGYDNYLYVPVEIKGDWLKVRDDKDCYIGEEPSSKDIIGWVRWRKNGEILIEVRH